MRRLGGLAWMVVAAFFSACGGSAFTSFGADGVGEGGAESSSGGGASGGANGGSSSGTASSSGATSSGTGSGTSGGSASGTGSSGSSGGGSASSSGNGGSSSGSSGTSNGTSSSGSSSSGMSSGMSSGSQGDAGGQDGGGGAIPCPTSAPAPGTLCTAAQAGLTCEWGTASVPECDPMATCTNGAWAFAPKAGADCAAESACPQTAPKSGTSCTGLSGTYCDYDYGNGATQYRCACTSGAEVSMLVSWICQDPGATCPMPRPRLGTACMSSAQVCGYGLCTSIPNGNQEGCPTGYGSLFRASARSRG